MPSDVSNAALKQGVATQIQLMKGPAPQNKMLSQAPENKSASTSPVMPRWSGRCVVAATGPSLTEAVAKRCESERCIAVNDAYRLMPFAEVLYGGDAEWWEVHGGCADFLGEKWSAHDDGMNPKLAEAHLYGLRLVAGRDAPGFSFDAARIHYGGNAGFQAINLAILFGATKILLVGFDMRVKGKKRHFFGDHPEGLTNAAVYEHFIPAFEAGAESLPAHIEVVNCTPGSALKCFPQMSLERALL